MADTTIDTAGAGEVDTSAGAASSEAEGFKAPESQEELDRIIQKRIERERAKFTDYEDIKTNAETLSAELEAAKAELAEASKGAGRVGELEAAVSAAEKRAERAEIAADVASAKGVRLRYLVGDTREELEASADEFLADARSASKVGVVPTQGTGDSAPRASSFEAGAQRAREKHSKQKGEAA